MKRRRKVFCMGCANLLYVGGKTRPLCVATADFIEGPLRKRIDVVNVTLAERKNVNNDCGQRVSVSLRAWTLKRWLLWRMNDGNEKWTPAREIALAKYPVEEESEQKERILWGEEEDDLEPEEDYEDDYYPEDFEESLRSNGRTDGDDRPGSSDKGGGENVQNAGDSGGLEREHVHEDKSGTDDRQPKVDSGSGRRAD